MKLFQLLALVLVLGFVSCSDDDDACLQSDWLGTYEGTIECDGVEEDVTVVITARGNDALAVTYETSILSASFEPLTPTECEFIGQDETGSTTIEIELDGNKFSFTETTVSAGVTTSCEIDATRQ